MSNILIRLLERLRERQSWCPYCGGEVVCPDLCALYGIWFKREEPTEVEE